MDAGRIVTPPRPFLGHRDRLSPQRSSAAAVENIKPKTAKGGAMMKLSERRARDRASRIATRPDIAETVGSAVGGLQREIAQTIALVMELGRQYDLGAMTAERERQVWGWAADAAVSYQGVVADLQVVNTNLSRLVTPDRAV